GCSCRLNRAAHFFRLLFEPEPAAGERRGLRALSLPVYKFSLEAWLEYRFRADRISYQKLISAPNMAASVRLIPSPARDLQFVRNRPKLRILVCLCRAERQQRVFSTSS